MKRVPAKRAGAEATRDDDTPPLRVLLVDDDALASKSTLEFLRREGHDATCVRDADDALAALRDAAGGIDAVLCAVGAGAGALLRDLTRRHRDVPVVMIASYATVEAAVDALRAGACDYLVRPIVDAELRQSLARAARQRALLSENAALRRRLDDRFNLDNIVGADPRMRRVYDMVQAVAPSRTTVLMEGESGTGKSLIAHAIHHHSPRRDRPFVELSCGSIPETLLESELFGHAKGSFTGAHADKGGKFLAANTGTIFLDEINSASPAMQLKLLRVLQERRFEPVGSTQTVDVDVRVILASNQPLEGLVASGQFRQDLYYRVNVVKIELPPLRERPGDIPLLAQRLLERHASEHGRAIVGFAPGAMEVLQRYPYPGNVRELQNIIERAVVLARGQTVQPEDLPPHLLARPAASAGPIRLAEDDEAWTPATLEDALREPERRIILRALRACGWSRQRTSEALGINRTTLYKKMKAHGLLGDERLAG
ncbi:MAG: sigma-54 dependent transcriptional regulator [Planctomycetota bacterium]|nr:sigma-54 dependent transcriptional regulator [Planctomycetota bacterium]